MNGLFSLEISIVIVTPDNFETIRNTVRCLRNQSAKDRMEVVIVVPSAKTLNLDDSELQGFARFRVIEVGKIRSIAWANAAGIRRASADVVVLAEDHSFPAPGWAEALIRAHRKPWAAVGPVVLNANPGSRVSWADLLISYGPWLDPNPGGTVEHLPGHNSSYKRAVLLEYGSELESMLEAESVLHWNLRAKGYQLYLEPTAKTSHMNFGLLSSWLPAQFYSGRMFAATRAQKWSILKRLLYTGGALLIPVVRFSRVLQQLNRLGNHHNLPSGMLPTLIIGLAVSAMGEMTGYALGAGEAKQKLSSFEFHRIRHIPEKERLSIGG